MSLPVWFAWCQSQRILQQGHTERLGNSLSHEVDDTTCGGRHKGWKTITVPNCILPEIFAEPAPGSQGTAAWCDGRAKAALCKYLLRVNRHSVSSLEPQRLW